MTRRPSRANSGRIENRERSDAMRYSNNVSSITWSQGISVFAGSVPAFTCARASEYEPKDRSEGSETRAAMSRRSSIGVSPSYTLRPLPIQTTAASRTVSSARGMSRKPGPRVGKVTSRMALRGARTSSRSVCPSGRMKAWTVTSAGISCADGSATIATAVVTARVSSASGRVFQSGIAGSVYCRP